jgi:hypothetical protein
MELPMNYHKLSWQERRAARELYISQQKGLCHYCGMPLSGPAREDIMSKKINLRLFPEGFFNHPVHLHHNHEDGMTIGAVHCHCNAVLWQYEHE